MAKLADGGPSLVWICVVFGQKADKGICTEGGEGVAPRMLRGGGVNSTCGGAGLERIVLELLAVRMAEYESMPLTPGMEQCTRENKCNERG